MILRLASLAVAVPTALLLAAAPVAAHQCTNASKKDPASGAQVIIGADDNVVWATQGVMNRIEQGLINPDTGEGFHGIIGFDFDGDLVVDFATYIVGPNDEIPLPAQMNGATCKGIVNVETYFSQCLEF